MAAWLIEEGGIYKIGFRYAGQLHKRSLKTRNKTKAETSLGVVNQNLKYLEDGVQLPPPGADLPTFLLTSGRRASKTEAKPLTLKALFEAYHTSLPEGSKEANTSCTEKIHAAHLCRVLGETKALPLSMDDLQRYVNTRSQEPGGRRGKRDENAERRISSVTIKKELSTLHLAWGWAYRRGDVSVGPLGRRHLTFPKIREPEPFQTCKQIEARIARGGLSDAEVGDLWASLYLEREEVTRVLAHVRKQNAESWIYPAMVFVAQTGARRSEALRSRIDDIDFTTRMLKIREKKRDKQRETTTRTVPMSRLLVTALKDWLSRHPGGQYTFCDEEGEPIEVNDSNSAFHDALKESKWHGKIIGWHVFRHSFASNCARMRVDQRMIDRWLGHSTDEMRRRYQHLFPDDQHEQLALVFG